MTFKRLLPRGLRSRFSIGRGSAGRRIALLAASGVLGLAGVIASIPAPAKAGPVVVLLSANRTVLVAGESTTLTAIAGTGPDFTSPVFWLYVVDTTTGTLVCFSTTGSPCTATVSESVATSQQFEAYVAPTDIFNVFPPPNALATSTPVQVAWFPFFRI